MTDTTNTLRAAFEAWAAKDEPPYKLERAPDPFIYAWGSTACAWKAFEAGAAHAVAQVQGEPVAPEHGQLDPRTAYATGKRMKAYCESFNGQQWGGVAESADRSNLAAALENLEEASAMLMNMAERVPLGPVIYAGALIDTAPATAEQPAERCTEGPAALIAFADEEITIPPAKRRRVTVRTAERPQAREVTDAEIDALLSDEVGFARSVARVRVYRVVRAAIALANGRG